MNGQELEMGPVDCRQNERWARQEAEEYSGYAQSAPPPQAAAPQPPPAPAAPAGGESATIEQLKQLAELKAQGILTEDEFAAQKAKLLG